MPASSVSRSFIHSFFPFPFSLFFSIFIFEGVAFCVSNIYYYKYFRWILLYYDAMIQFIKFSTSFHLVEVYFQLFTFGMMKARLDLLCPKVYLRTQYYS